MSNILDKFINDLVKDLEAPLRKLAEEWQESDGIRFVDNNVYKNSYNKALKYFKQGNFVQAEKFFLQCIEGDSKNTLSPVIRANCANHLGAIYKNDPSKALPFLIYAADVEPKSIIYHKNLAGFYWNHGEYINAYYQAKKCVALANDQLQPELMSAAVDCAMIVGAIEPYSNSF
jgi:tetratricopeptide (TPR) repeat protein